jgi:ribonucleases P/MRP protein subunit RPP40
LTSDLKGKNHVIACESKANSMLGMIKKTFGSIDIKLLRTLYLVFVRPLIEFAVPVWSPSFKGDISCIERIQRRATRLVKKLRKRPYDERLSLLNLTTLENRRQRGDMIQLYKIFNGLEKVDLVAKPTFKNNLRGHDMSYSREICKFSARQEFLTNRAASNWSSLSAQCIKSKDINSFKSNLDYELNNFEQV